MEFFTENWGKILAGIIGLAEIIVRLTPSDQDNSILNLIKRIIDAIIPNFRIRGGKHS